MPGTPSSQVFTLASLSSRDLFLPSLLPVNIHISKRLREGFAWPFPPPTPNLQDLPSPCHFLVIIILMCLSVQFIYPIPMEDSGRQKTSLLNRDLPTPEELGMWQ